MKVVLLLACTCTAILSSNRVTSAAIHAPLDIITLDDLSEADRKELEFLDSQFATRPKRSGDLLAHLKATLGQGIKNKLGLIAKGSASAVSHFSSGSSGHGHGHQYHHDVPETYDHKSFDFWALKKSILNTLLQAVKAIKGGVLAIKGQLIKGGGHLISAKGKIISAKGEAITTLGKHIASTAILSPFHGHSSSGGDSYGHGHQFHHSGPGGAEYGSPSAPGPEYGIPEHVHHEHEADHHHHPDKPPYSGILILKKIPGHEHGHAQESKVPAFKPLEPTGPSYGTILSKFLSASSSLKPHEPAPFADYDTHSSHHEPLHDYGSPHEETHHEHDQHDHHHHEHDHHDHHHHEEYISPTPSKHSSSESHVYHSDTDGLKPPATSYGAPFEDSPSYLDYDGLQSPSKKSPKKVLPKQQIKPAAFLPTAPAPLTIGNLSSPDYLDNAYERPKLFIGTQDPNTLPNIESFPPYPGPLPADFIAKYGLGLNNPLQEQSSLFTPNINFKLPPTASAYQAPLSSPSTFKMMSINPSSSANFVTPSRQSHQKNKKAPSNYDVVRSITYQLGPNGPQKV